MNYVTIKQDALVLQELFDGRKDTFGIQLKNGGYLREKRPITLDDFIAHRKTEITIGIYLIRPKDNTVSLAVIDLDSKETSLLKKLLFAVRKVGFNDNQYLVEFSGNKGYHIWFRFTNPIPAKKAKALGDIIVNLAGVSAEVFPKQTSIVAGGFGNLIKLPGLHQKSKKFSQFLTPDLNPTDISILKKISRITEAEVDEIIKEFDYLLTPEPAPRSQTSSGNESSRALPCLKRILLAGIKKGHRDEACFRLAVHLRRNGWPQDLAQEVLLRWNVKNSPPLKEYAIITKLKSAYNKPYVGFGCGNPLMKEFCSDDCPVKVKAIKNLKG